MESNLIVILVIVVIVLLKIHMPMFLEAADDGCYVVHISNITTKLIWFDPFIDPN